MTRPPKTTKRIIFEVYEVSCDTYNSLLAKVDPDSRYKLRIECPIRILVQQARFPNTRVAKSKEFNKIVILSTPFGHFASKLMYKAMFI